MDQLTSGDKKIRIFLPMCGKAGDLSWLWQQGHTVTGVEGVPFVVEQFFRYRVTCYSWPCVSDTL